MHKVTYCAQSRTLFMRKVNKKCVRHCEYFTVNETYDCHVKLQKAEDHSGSCLEQFMLHTLGVYIVEMCLDFRPISFHRCTCTFVKFPCFYLCLCSSAKSVKITLKLQHFKLIPLVFHSFYCFYTCLLQVAITVYRLVDKIGYFSIFT